jgi:hypothetical protein
MKGVLVLLALAAITTLNAEPTQDESLEAAAMRRAKDTPPILEEIKPNEITVGSVSYSGVAVEIANLFDDNLFQLINPAAPARYGNGEDNLVRDPITDRPSGLKLFSIAF